jgi:type VI secretion system protein ImpE
MAEPEALIREGKLAEALKELQDRIRKSPADPKLRVFLFQLLCILGDWERAITQLNVAAEMDPKAMDMALVYRPVLNCEALRAEVFAGRRAPHVFGEPEEWVGWMVQANQMVGEGHYQASQELRAKALEAAPATPGTIDGKPFEWIMDNDPRLGPILETFVDGRYFWVPMHRIRRVVTDKPVDLRDKVWLPAQFVWANGGAAVGFIPARYPGSEAAEDPAIRLAQRTDWVDRGSELFLGLGQRMFATDEGDYSLFDVRAVTLGAEPEGQELPDLGEAAAEAPDQEEAEDA